MLWEHEVVGSIPTTPTTSASGPIRGDAGERSRAESGRRIGRIMGVTDGSVPPGIMPTDGSRHARVGSDLSIVESPGSTPVVAPAAATNDRHQG